MKKKTCTREKGLSTDVNKIKTKNIYMNTNVSTILIIL